MSAAVRSRVKINRAPVLTLWATVVAERLGFQWEEALTFGRAVAGLNAYSKGKALGLFHPQPKEVKEKRQALRHEEAITVDLLGRAVPARRTAEGLRALSKDRPITPESVERYLDGKFKDALDDVREAMTELARSLPPERLAASAYDFYEQFRPEIPAGKSGWGAQGWLSIEGIRKLAR